MKCRNRTLQGMLALALAAVLAGCSAESAPTDPGSPPGAPPPSPGGPTLDPGFNPSSNLIEVFFDSGRSGQENGNVLETILESVQPGDLVRIHAGTWVINNRLGLNAIGTEQNPITIEGADGEVVVITRDNASQNVMNIDVGSYLTVRGIEFTGGSTGVKVYDVNHLYFVDNEVHNTAGNAIAANSTNTSYLYFVDNHIHDTNGAGEGFYLGAHDGSSITHHCYVVGNHVHDTGGSQGDGVEIKRDSYACVVSDNLIENSNYPGILVYGNGGRPERNIVERNVVIASTEGGIQVAADAIVRNNLFIGAGDAAIVSQPHNGVNPGNLDIVNNTLVNSGRALRVSGWAGAPNVVVANNAIYSQSGQHISGDTGSAILSSNVLLSDLSAFVAVSLDGSARDATPAPGSPLVGAGDGGYVPSDDLNRKVRAGAVEVGAVDLD